jgi:hypothetical protein
MIKLTTELLSKALVAKKDEARKVGEQDRKVIDKESHASL